VAECAVIGVPDEQRGQIVKAFVVLCPGQVGDDAWCKRCRTSSNSHHRALQVPARGRVPQTAAAHRDRQAAALQTEGIMSKQLLQPAGWAAPKGYANGVAASGTPGVRRRPDRLERDRGSGEGGDRSDGGAAACGIHHPLMASENGCMTDADPSPQAQPRNPLHGLTLEAIVTALQQEYGWEGLDARIPLRCFAYEPSIASSLKFLRKTPWAREKVEGLYLFMLRERQRSRRG
jgi:hypothetical protein